MHLLTVIKTKANSEQEAIDNVNEILTCYGDYNFGGGCDYVAEEKTRVLKDFTEEDFLKLREDELKEYKDNLGKALEMKDDDFMKGYYLVASGEALQEDVFWSTQRYAYTDENNEGESTYYAITDRHF